MPEPLWRTDKDKERLHLYEENTLLYAGEFVRVWRDLKPLEPQFPVVSINFHKQHTDAITNFLFREALKVAVENQDAETTAAVNEIIRVNRYLPLMKRTGQWESVLGDVVHLHYLEDGFPRIQFVHPKHFFGEFDPLDQGRLVRATFAYPIVEQTGVPGANERVVYVYRQIHELRDGQAWVVHQLWKADADRLLEPVPLTTLSRFAPIALRAAEGSAFFAADGLSVEEPMGIDELPVVHFKNLECPGEPYGRSDYTPSLKQKSRAASETMTQYNMVRAKHSNPKLALPEKILKALRDQRQGKVAVDRELFDLVAVKPGEPLPQYLEWDGKLEAAKNEIEILRDEYFAEAQIAKPLLSQPTASLEGGETGRANIIKLLPTIGLAQTKHQLLEPAIQADLRIAQKLMNASRQESKRFDVSEVRITWPDGLPADDFENIRTIQLRVDGGTLSRKSAMMRLDDMTDAEAEAELERIQEEREQFDPASFLTEVPPVEAPAE